MAPQPRRMTDLDRSEKLAAARRKLKAFQTKLCETEVKSNVKSTYEKEVFEGMASCKRQEVTTEIVDIPAKQMRVELESDASDRRSIEEMRPEHLATDPDQKAAATGLTSSTESLRQISMQLNGMVLQTHDLVHDADCTPASVSDLEQRNQQLASLLNDQTKRNEILVSEIVDLKGQVDAKNEELKKEKKEFEEKQFREQSSLREQLQVHIQTIGILVAEKTELQSSLAQSQQTAKQKAGEVEELHGRLKASRQKVIDLERELSLITVSSQQFEKNSKENESEVSRLKMDLYKVTKANEELSQQNSETLLRLNEKLSECKDLQENVDELRKKVAVADVKLKQLATIELDVGGGAADQLESLQLKNVDLERETKNLKNALASLTEDHSQAIENYRKFAQQLTEQVQSLKTRVTELSAANDELKQSNSSLVEEVSAVRDELANNKTNGELVVDDDDDDDEKVTALENEVHRLRKLESEFKEHQSAMTDNLQLMKLIEEKERQIEQLVFSLGEAQNSLSQVDQHQLLETIQSNKVAASRAMAQNKELKKQIEELENGFVKMSNDKLALTEKLLHEQHVTKELGERFSQQEEEMKELREQLGDKERRLSLVQKSSTELTKQMYQQHQIADRMRHFEAQGHLTELLQEELNQAQARVGALSNQNGELRTLLANQAEKLLKPVDVGESDGTFNSEVARRDELVLSLSASVRQLELERNQLLRQLEEQQMKRESVRDQLAEMRMGDVKIADEIPCAERSDKNVDDAAAMQQVSYKEYCSLKQTMAKLEERFIRTMKDISDLSDEKQKLEHLVMQLQGETETIGDYISLYQMQRHVMKQQVAKKDEYIATVCRDREELKEKLAKLQELVYKLLYERQGKTRIDNKLANGSDDPENRRLNDVVETLNISDLDEVATDKETSSHSPVTNGEDGGGKAPAEMNVNPAKTARKIMDLISEIGSTNLTDNLSLTDNFHPCAVCSGRLLTV